MSVEEVAGLHRERAERRAKVLSSKEIQAPCGSLFNFSVNNHKVPVRWTVDARCRQCSPKRCETQSRETVAARAGRKEGAEGAQKPCSHLRRQT